MCKTSEPARRGNNKQSGAHQGCFIQVIFKLKPFFSLKRELFHYYRVKTSST